MIKFSSVALCLSALIHVSAGASVCAPELWPDADAKVAGAETLGFVLRGFDSATLIVRAKAAAATPLPGVDGVKAPASLTTFADGVVTAVFAGPRAALLDQAAAIAKDHPDARFAVKYGVHAGQSLDLAQAPKRTFVAAVTPASLAKVLRGKVGPVHVTNLHDQEFFFAFTPAQLGELDAPLLAALKIEEVAGPLAKLAALPAGAWIVRGDEHVVASAAAAQILFDLADLDVAQSRAHVADELRARIDRCLNASCSPRESLPENLATAPAVVRYLLERFGVAADAPDAAAATFDKMYEIFAPGETRAAPFNHNDADLTLNERFNFKAAKARVMAAWTELAAKAELAAPPVPPTPPAAKKKRAPRKPAPPKAPVVQTEPAAPVAPPAPVAPVAPEVPAPKVAAVAPVEAVAPAPVITQNLAADDEDESADVARFRRFLTAGLDQSAPGHVNDPLTPEAENAIVNFLERFEGVKHMNTAASFTKAFSSVFHSLKHRALSQAEYGKWRLQLVKRATEFAPKSKEPASPRAGLGIAWRMVQLMINDPGARHAISVASVRATEELIYKKLKETRPDEFFKKRVN